MPETQTPEVPQALEGWFVLHDALVFKSRVHGMRFDPASARYAEFGPFYVGIRREPNQLAECLAGRLT